MPYLTDPRDLGSLIGDEPSYRADQLHDWLYRTPVLTTAEMTNLPPSLRESLADRLWPFAVEAEQSADDGTTRKGLSQSHDAVHLQPGGLRTGMHLLRNRPVRVRPPPRGG